MTILSQHSALSPGHELWVLPRYELSQWTPQLDWMMNFQILKNIRHQPQQTPPEIHQILSENEIQTQSVEINTDQLLIPSNLFFPNRWVLYSPWHPDLLKSENKRSDWTDGLHKTWTELRAPATRVFLARGWNAFDLHASWEKLGTQQELAFVSDPS